MNYYVVPGLEIPSYIKQVKAVRFDRLIDKSDGAIIFSHSNNMLNKKYYKDKKLNEIKKIFYSTNEKVKHVASLKENYEIIRVGSQQELNRLVEKGLIFNSRVRA